MTVEFNPEAKKEFEWLLTRFPNKQAALIPTLHLAQREFDWISGDVIEYVAGLLDLTPMYVLDTVTFYTWFKKKPTGKYLIQVCHTLSCSLMGAEHIVEYLKKKLSIGVGETTPDNKFTLVKVECLGSCDTAPMMQVNDDYYENLTPEEIDRILDSLE